MTSKTHIAANAAITTAIMQPNNLKDLAICLTVSTIGSVISDIDVTTSESRKDLLKIIMISVFSIAICAFLEYFFHIGIVSFIESQTTLLRIITGFALFLVICCYGMCKPHRTFMHSILGTIILSSNVYLILPTAIIPFAIGMLSHIFLDLFNHKKIQVFFPFKLRIYFNLCSANGLINNLLCTISTIIFGIELGMFIL